ncbi:uncharacterized protein K02A2.6-like [Macrobrachium nipponense]|uniref:uncharacterized protein K02A2.6-like n=1 Tax=Macrobrachium nipponense TaxID=159736 RepID=UPI0030C8A42E
MVVTLLEKDEMQNLVAFEIDHGAAVSTITKEWVFYVVDSCNTNLCKDLMQQVGIYLAGIDEGTRVIKVANVSAEKLLDNYLVDSSKPITGVLAKIHIKAAYLDDIIVSGAAKKELDHRLRKVLELLQAHNVQINKTKTFLEAESIEYLGYHISGEGVEPSSKGLKAILDCPFPTSVEEVQSFLGILLLELIINHYWDFLEEGNIPCNANSKIQRWALLLSQYDYELVYKPGKENAVKHFTNKDAVLSQLKNCLKLGWSKEHNMSLLEYASVKDDLSLHNDVILYRNRVLIPVELRCKVLNHLHCGHNGINAMKAEARNWIWWPKIDQDIGEVTKNCSICFKNFTNPRAPTVSWPIVGKSWSRLHIDYAGLIDGKYFLIIVDSHSKFLDIRLSCSTMSAVTIGHLRKTFCNFGTYT